MSAPKAGRVAPGLIRHDPPKFSATGERRKLCRLSALNTQAIRAELWGSDRCRALGIAVRAPSPILKMCRRLLAAGVDPARPLHAYRDAMLCLIVRSIGVAAGREISSKGSGFVRHRAVRTASPIAPLARPAVPRPGGCPRHRRRRAPNCAQAAP